MKTLNTVLAILAVIILTMFPHLLVITIWYPIGLILYGVYKGFKSNPTTKNKGVQ